MFTYVNFNIQTTHIAEIQVSDKLDDALLRNISEYCAAHGSSWVTLCLNGDFRDRPIELRVLCCDTLIKQLTDSRQTLSVL